MMSKDGANQTNNVNHLKTVKTNSTAQTDNNIVTLDWLL